MYILWMKWEEGRCERGDPPVALADTCALLPEGIFRASDSTCRATSAPGWRRGGGYMRGYVIWYVRGYVRVYVRERVC